MRIILKKENQEFNAKPGETFYVNDGFVSRLLKFKAALINHKETVQKEEEDISSKLDADRRNLLEATIVRILKTRKTITHSELVSETMRIVNNIFQPTQLLIKQRIESLMEKDFL
jgi:cullin 3